VSLISEKELIEIAQTFLRENYQTDLDIPIKRNNRLRTTLGRFVISSDQRPLRIEIAGNTLKYGSPQAIVGILKHECIHYIFHKQGKQASDGDPYFEAELKKHGAPSTNSSKIGLYYVYSCNACGERNETRLKQLKHTPEKYQTSCCRSTLKIIGERVYDGT